MPKVEEKEVEEEAEIKDVSEQLKEYYDQAKEQVSIPD